MEQYQVIVAWSGACILKTTNLERAINYANQHGDTKVYVFAMKAKMIVHRSWIPRSPIEVPQVVGS